MTGRKTATMGRHTIDHCAKPMGGRSGNDSDANPTNATVVGEPTIVPMPPMLAAYAIPSSRTLPKTSRAMFVASPGAAPRTSADSASWLTTAIAMGRSISVVAVFEIHIDRAAVVTMKPRMIGRGRDPKRAIALRAMRRCRFHASIACAIRNPPMKRKMMWFA